VNTELLVLAAANDRRVRVDSAHHGFILRSWSGVAMIPLICPTPAAQPRRATVLNARAVGCSRLLNSIRLRRIGQPSFVDLDLRIVPCV
jgi:hypothetical protein